MIEINSVRVNTIFIVVIFVTSSLFILNVTCNNRRYAAAKPERPSSHEEGQEESIIQFPMLELFSKSMKSKINITNWSNFGFTNGAKNHKERLNSGSTRFQNVHGHHNKTQTQNEAVGLVINNNNNNKDYFSNAIDAILEDSPPPVSEISKMARYIVANSGWASMSTISTREPTIGYPFSNIVSMSDGKIGESTGNIYFYVTPLDVSMIDLQVNNKTTVSMTLAQGDYCKEKNYDAEDPRCARVIISGSVTKLEEGSSEEAIAKDALFSRHAGMSDWPKDHGFFCSKMNIFSILLLDYFGGAKSVPIKEYFATDPY